MPIISDQIYLYDVEKQETRELLMPNLPINYTPFYMCWLDDRYFLFVIQLDHGSVSGGGNVCIYDIETDDYAMILKNEGYRFQTYKIDVFEQDFIVFSSFLWDETMNFTETLFHTLKYDKIFELYHDKEIFILYTQK